TTAPASGWASAAAPAPARRTRPPDTRGSSDPPCCATPAPTAHRARDAPWPPTTAPTTRAPAAISTGRPLRRPPANEIPRSPAPCPATHHLLAVNSPIAGQDRGHSGTGQGGSVLTKSSPPAVSADTHDHGARRPSTSDATRVHTPIASSASATSDP